MATDAAMRFVCADAKEGNIILSSGEVWMTECSSLYSLRSTVMRTISTKEWPWSGTSVYPYLQCRYDGNNIFTQVFVIQPCLCALIAEPLYTACDNVRDHCCQMLLGYITGIKTVDSMLMPALTTMLR